MNAYANLSYSRVAAECARDSAYDIAMAWEDQPEAVALLSRIDMLERLADHWAGDALLKDAAENVSCAAATLTDDELYHARQKLLSAALDGIADESGYEFDRLDTNAPAVAEAVARARKAQLGLSVLPFKDALPSLAAARAGWVL